MFPSKRIISKQLGELLIEKKIINKAQLTKALEIQKDRGGLIGQILVSLGYAKEEDIAQVLTVQYGFPYLPLGNYDIDEDVIKTIPEQVARQYYVIPIDKIGNTLTIAMADPLNEQAIDDVELLSNCTIQLFVSTATDIREAIDRYYKKKS